MTLSTPIYNLKRSAKAISRELSIPLHAALDTVAQKEGFKSWSLLAHHAKAEINPSILLSQIEHGQLILLGARPGHGKTLLALELLARAINTGRSGYLFTLEYTRQDVIVRLTSLGKQAMFKNNRFIFDGSDSICATYIIKQLTEAKKGALVVIDYLQLLDQKRCNPELSIQIQTLKKFATHRGITILCIAQIDRSFTGVSNQPPTLEDVRLPNPLDLSLFDGACFIHNSKIKYTAT